MISVTDTPILYDQVMRFGEGKRRLDEISVEAQNALLDLDRLALIGNEWKDGLDDTARNQIYHADAIYLNKLGKLEDDQIQAVEDTIRDLLEKDRPGYQTKIHWVTNSASSPGGLVSVDQVLAINKTYFYSCLYH